MSTFLQNLPFSSCDSLASLSSPICSLGTWLLVFHISAQNPFLQGGHEWPIQLKVSLMSLKSLMGTISRIRKSGHSYD